MIGAALTFASVFLPWWDVSGSASAGGSPFLILILIGGLLAFVGLVRRRVRVYAIVLILVGTILSFVAAIEAMSLIGPLGACDSGMCYSWELSWGFYLAVFASAMMLISLKSRSFRATQSSGIGSSFKMPRLHVPSFGHMKKHYPSNEDHRKFGLMVTALINLCVGLFSLYPVISYGLIYSESYYFLVFGILSIVFAWELWRRRRWAPRVTLLIIILLLAYLVTNIGFANVLEGIPLIILFETVCYVYARRLTGGMGHASKSRSSQTYQPSSLIDCETGSHRMPKLGQPFPPSDVFARGLVKYLNSGSNCPKCDASVHRSDAICRQCGFPLQTIQEFVENKGKFGALSFWKQAPPEILKGEDDFIREGYVRCPDCNSLLHPSVKECSLCRMRKQWGGPRNA